jgi:uncharacterized protein YndB with AHSA1/START domain
VVDRTRGYALRLEVAAPPEALWRGMVEPTLIAEWDLAGMQISPRAGGSFKIRLDKNMEREAHIDVFQPPSRLRLIYMQQPSLPDTGNVIVDDFIIDAGKTGGSRLCLLGSGFPHNFDYADLFQRAQNGWTQALARLKVATERRVRSARV